MMKGTRTITGLIFVALMILILTLPAFAMEEINITVETSAEAMDARVIDNDICALSAIGGIGANPSAADYYVPAEITRYYGASIGKNGRTMKIDGASVTITLARTTLPQELLAVPYQDFQLIANSTNWHDLSANRIRLQKLMDIVSNAGGGEIKIEAGKYFMNPEPNTDLMMHHRFGNVISYCLRADNNVTLSGTLDTNYKIATWILPYGTNNYACNTFHYFDESSSPTARVNADFYDLGINNIYYTNTDTYLCQGKGFMITPTQNCDWYNVIVLNAGGTGFGIDQPVNCTIRSCTAIGCGRDALSDDDAGASGFGIGYGKYSSEESILLSKCLAFNNRKFGIFFENQYRFEETKGRLEVKSLQAENCISAGNLFNYGGEYCFGAEYFNCLSYATASDITNINAGGLNLTNKKAFHFGINSGANFVDGVKFSEKMTRFHNGNDSRLFFMLQYLIHPLSQTF